MDVKVGQHMVHFEDAMSMGSRDEWSLTTPRKYRRRLILKPWGSDTSLMVKEMVLEWQ